MQRQAAMLTMTLRRTSEQYNDAVRENENLQRSLDAARQNSIAIGTSQDKLRESIETISAENTQVEVTLGSKISLTMLNSCGRKSQCCGSPTPKEIKP